MRYADGGGLTQAGRRRREQVRQQAADLFTAGVSAIEVAAQLEVSTKSAYAWRRAWKAGGSEALQSKGTSGARSKLSDDQMRRLQQRPEAGPAASGYVEDQRWTLPRVVKLIATICHVQYSIKGASLLLHRMGWTPQMPSHRAVERDEAAIIYRAMVHKGHKGEKKGFREADFAALVDAAHQQLAGPIVLVWDNLQRHVSAKMKALIAARPWLRVYTLPAYAPELNPVEKVWSHLKRSLANLAAGNATNLSRLAKTKLGKMQYVDGLIDGFFRATGLSSP